MVYMFKQVNGNMVGHVLEGQHRTLALMVRYHKHVRLGEIPATVWMPAPPPEPVVLNSGVVFDIFINCMRLPKMGVLYDQMQQAKREDQSKLRIPKHLKHAYAMMIEDHLRQGKSLLNFINATGRQALLSVLYTYQRKYVEQRIRQGNNLCDDDVKFIKLADLVSHTIRAEDLHGDMDHPRQPISHWIEHLVSIYAPEKWVYDPIRLAFKVVDGQLVGQVISGEHRLLALLRHYGLNATLGKIPPMVWKSSFSPLPLFEMFMQFPTMGELYRQIYVTGRESHVPQNQ